MGPIKPGDRFLMVHEDHRGNTAKHRNWVTVVKVGRKWADFEHEGRGWRRKDHRFDMETMMVDSGGFTSPGRVYRDEAHIDQVERFNRLWNEFRHQIERRWTRPESINDIAILKAADALGFRLKEE